MASRRRYRLDQVAVEAGDVRKARWSFAKGGRQAPVRGNEHRYTVTDGNLAGRNTWEFLVRVPDEADGRVEIRPRSTPDTATWKALTYRSLQFQRATKGDARGKRYAKVSLAVPQTGRAKSDPRGTRTKDVIRADQRGDLPKWFESLRGRMRRKESVRSTRGTDGNQLVILVSPEDHEMMIRLYFAMKVWVLKEGIELE